MRRVLVAAALLCALAAAPARAAYSPQLTVQVQPATPATAAALTATLTQAQGEDATQSERVRNEEQEYGDELHTPMLAQGRGRY